MSKKIRVFFALSLVFLTVSCNSVNDTVKEATKVIFKEAVELLLEELKKEID